MKLLRLYFVLGLSFAFACASDSRDSCKTPSGQDGKCVPIQECPQLSTIQKDSSADSEVLLGHQCEQSGAEKTYCCPVLSEQVKCGSALNTRFPEDIGNSTELFQFPWMALIAYNSTKDPFKCAGSVISSRYILTTASCLSSRYQPIYVRLGEYDLDKEKDCKSDVCAPPTQDIPIEKITVHPSYSNEVRHNDIALLKLQKDADFSSYAVRPVCLHLNPSAEDYEGKRFVINSWVVFRGGTSPVLLKNIVQGISNENCSKAFEKARIKIAPSQLCAKAESGDNCIGVAGSPLVSYEIMKDQTIAVQYGILSLGTARCDDNEYPLVYTNVNSYKDWIQETMD